MTIGNEGIDGPPFNPSNVSITGGTISGVTISGSTVTENFTASTNPASSVATATAIVDAYNGVVVTLTAAGNTQTLQAPTTTATIRKFMVINNDTSTHNLSVVANGVTFTLTPGEGQCFIWDVSAWGPTDLGITAIPVPVTQGGTGLSTVTDHGVMLGSGTGAVTPTAVGATGEVLIGQTDADPIWSNSPSVTNLTVATLLTMSDQAKAQWDTVPATTDTFSGDTETVTVGETISAIWTPLYLKSDGKWWICDADQAATMPAMRISLATAAADATCLVGIRGWGYKSTWTWTCGGLLYASTSGALTQTAPSGDGDQIQILGVARGSAGTLIEWNPSPLLTEIGLDVVDVGTATPTAITWAELSSVPKTWQGDHSSDQTFTLGAASAADIGKEFRLIKDGTGAGKIILDVDASITIVRAADASSAGGTATSEASKYQTAHFKLISTALLYVTSTDGTWTLA